MTYLPKGEALALDALTLFYLRYSAFRGREDIVDSAIISSTYGNSQSRNTFEGRLEDIPIPVP